MLMHDELNERPLAAEKDLDELESIEDTTGSTDVDSEIDVEDAAIPDPDDDLISTKCIPLKKHELSDHEAKTLFCAGEECGIMYYDDEYQEDWWRCKQCLNPFCRDCSDTFLSDETGLCEDCGDSEKSILSSFKNRIRSKL